MNELEEIAINDIEYELEVSKQFPYLHKPREVAKRLVLGYRGSKRPILENRGRNLREIFKGERINMKPLTIEELKNLANEEWIWVELKDKFVLKYDDFIYEYRCSNRSSYFQISKTFEKSDKLTLLTPYEQYSLFLPYSDYGTTWLAYKNKEQAEGEYDSRVEEAKKQTAKAIIGELKGEMAIATYTFNPMLASELKTIYLRLEKEYGVEVDE